MSRAVPLQGSGLAVATSRTARPDALLKVGGSLGRRPAALRRLMAVLGAAARSQTLVVVPGGGAFADAIRRADRRFGLDDSAAHWMAILAMDQYAHLLAALTPGARVIRNPEEVAAGRLNVLAVSAWLGRADPLPHSWAVTSDSIAAWVARRLRARRLVLLKNVDGQFDRDPHEPEARLLCRVPRDRLRGVVDAYFARALGPRLPCWIVNGANPGRVLELLETGGSKGTRVL
jgi:5-(aminomethyl)-3-furanmethanol phosphate kinase